MSSAPECHIDLSEFRENPYPALKQMRAEAPIAYVPELGRTLLTRLMTSKPLNRISSIFLLRSPRV